MPCFATENAVTTADKSGDPAWIEITADQHAQAIDALVSGLEVIVAEGFLIRDKQPSPDHEWQNGEWVYVPPPEPEPETPPIPDSASKLGLKRALDEIGLWQTVKAAIAADPDAQEEWDLAVEVKRTDPITQRLIAALSLSSEQVDALILRANELVA
ncbi:hypothetical protein [Afipia carboxidovorans]|uniref:hypothetical protein n=1 Tax=Afipia carboxidovorans TaxID=40137 RepID=UPI003092543F|nr:hypothetical protein CRBSH125_35290 [Afipia carboxidovorans]